MKPLTAEDLAVLVARLLAESGLDLEGLLRKSVRTSLIERSQFSERTTEWLRDECDYTLD